MAERDAAILPALNTMAHRSSTPRTEVTLPSISDLDKMTRDPRSTLMTPPRSVNGSDDGKYPDGPDYNNTLAQPHIHYHDMSRKRSRSQMRDADTPRGQAIPLPRSDLFNGVVPPPSSTAFAYDVRQPFKLNISDSMYGIQEARIIQAHRASFGTRFPRFRGDAPSLENYQVTGSFQEEFVRRVPRELLRGGAVDSSTSSRTLPLPSLPPPPPPAETRSVLHEVSMNRFYPDGSIGRVTVPQKQSPEPQYGPYQPSPVPVQYGPVHVAQPPVTLTASPDVSEHYAQRPRSGSISSESSGSTGYTPRVAKRRRRTKSSMNSASSAAAALALSKEPKHQRQRSTKEQRSKDFRDYPDFAPPASAMRDPDVHVRALKEYQVKDPLDLANDTLAAQLAPAEQAAAKRLHLQAHKYLLMKRQIFERFAHWLSTREGNWNRTAAQQAVNQDVGKASELFKFYEAVGWFDEALFQDRDGLVVKDR